jgi:hypothetical protein
MWKMNGAWYDLPPADYATSLRYQAQRCDDLAVRAKAEGNPWGGANAAHCRRQARRLRAMAKLCQLATVERAGEIDFRELNHPDLRNDRADRIIKEIEAIK